MFSWLEEKVKKQVQVNKRKTQARNQLAEVRNDLLNTSGEFLKRKKGPRKDLISAKRYMYERLSFIESQFYLGYLIVPEKDWEEFQYYTVQNMVLSYIDSNNEEKSIELTDDIEDYLKYPKHIEKKNKFSKRMAIDSRIKSDLKNMAQILIRMARI